nr:hypothetical protein [Tanacetum cinerariifolium]
EESHRVLGSSSGVQKPTVSAFVSKTSENQNKSQNINNNVFKIQNASNNNVSNNQNNSGSNNQKNNGRYNSLSYKNCGMTDVLRLLVGHPNGITVEIRKDLKKDNILGTGSEVGGLYVFNIEWNHLSFTYEALAICVLIDKEDLSEGNNFENFKVPNLLFNTKESNTLRRSSRQLKLPPKLNYYVLDCKARIFEPKSYEEVALDKNWVQAMNEKMHALYENNTWDLVELPRNRRAIRSKWVYKTKLKSTGEIDRYKARLVAKGFNPKEGIDYKETFSLVVKMGTVSQHMHAPIQSYMDLCLRVLRYLKGTPGSGITFEKSEHKSLKKSKKQATLFKSSVEAEYRSMAAATCELIWIVNILKDLK